MRPLDLLTPQDGLLRDAVQFGRHLTQTGPRKPIRDPPFKLRGRIDNLLRSQLAIVHLGRDTGCGSNRRDGGTRGRWNTHWGLLDAVPSGKRDTLSNLVGSAEECNQGRSLPAARAERQNRRALRTTA